MGLCWVAGQNLCCSYLKHDLFKNNNRLSVVQTFVKAYTYKLSIYQAFVKVYSCVTLPENEPIWA